MSEQGDAQVRDDVRRWIAEHWDPEMPLEKWWAELAESGWAFPDHPTDWFGRGLPGDSRRIVREELDVAGAFGPPHGISTMMVAPLLLDYGTDEQRQRWLPGIVTGSEVWCQLFSEPEAGSDLAAVRTRAVRDGEQWIINGQKVWTSGAHAARWGILIARTDPSVSKHSGLSFFGIDMHQPGVEARPLVQITGDAEFNETFLDAVRIPDSWRIGGVGEGWKVANATLSGERSMGAGSGGIERLGGRSVERLVAVARELAAAGRGGWSDPLVRQRLAALWAGEKVLIWTNTRARDLRRSGRPPGPEASIGKLLSAEHNLALQEAWIDLSGMRVAARADDDEDARSIAYGFLRSRANTIEGGTAQIQRNILGERVLGLPREPDPWLDAPWRDVPKS